MSLQATKASQRQTPMPRSSIPLREELFRRSTIAPSSHVSAQAAQPKLYEGNNARLMSQIRRQRCASDKAGIIATKILAKLLRWLMTIMTSRN